MSSTFSQMNTAMQCMLIEGFLFSQFANAAASMSQLHSTHLELLRKEAEETTTTEEAAQLALPAPEPAAQVEPEPQGFSKDELMRRLAEQAAAESAARQALEVQLAKAQQALGLKLTVPLPQTQPEAQGATAAQPAADATQSVAEQSTDAMGLLRQVMPQAAASVEAVAGTEPAVSTSAAGQGLQGAEQQPSAHVGGSSGSNANAASRSEPDAPKVSSAGVDKVLGAAQQAARAHAAVPVLPARPNHIVVKVKDRSGTDAGGSGSSEGRREERLQDSGSAGIESSQRQSGDASSTADSRREDERREAADSRREADARKDESRSGNDIRGDSRKESDRARSRSRGGGGLELARGVFDSARCGTFNKLSSFIPSSQGDRRFTEGSSRGAPPDARRPRSRSRNAARSSVSTIAAEGPVTREILAAQESYRKSGATTSKQAPSAPSEIVTGAKVERLRRQMPARGGWDKQEAPADIRPVQMPSKPAMVGGGGNHKVLKLSAMQIRAFLGRGGATIRNIRETTGADIKIHHPPTEEYGHVSIVGNVELVEYMIHQAIVEKGCAMTPVGRGPGAIGNVGDEEEVFVPQSVGCLIIGENGEGLRTIKSAVPGQVTIQAHAPTMSGGPIKLVVGGSGRKQAVSLLKTRVAELSRSHAATSGNNFM